MLIYGFSFLTGSAKEEVKLNLLLHHAIFSIGNAEVSVQIYYLSFSSHDKFLLARCKAAAPLSRLFAPRSGLPTVLFARSCGASEAEATAVESDVRPAPVAVSGAAEPRVAAHAAPAQNTEVTRSWAFRIGRRLV